MLDEDLVAGGQNPRDLVIKKCQEEVLEEMYSNKLFAIGSPTLTKATQLYNRNALAMTQIIENILSNKEFDVLQPIKVDLLAVMKQPGLDVANRIKALKQKLMTEAAKIMDQSGQKRALRDEELEVKWVRFKCRMYEHMFPQQYSNFCEWLDNRLVEMDETTNECDPRNTNAAYMVTIPHWLLLSRQQQVLNETNWMLQPRGGDDAVSAKISRIDDLFDLSKNNDMPPYSAHGRIFLNVLEDIERKKPGYFDHQVRGQQLETILQHIQVRELAELGLVRRGQALLQTSSPNQGGNLNLPNLSTQAALSQYNRAAANGGALEIVEFAFDVHSAQNFLRDKLGEVGYARLEGMVEIRSFPPSVWVQFAKLTAQGRANILLDDSGSMKNEYASDRQTQNWELSRWYEASCRIVDIMEFLSLAGVEVDLYFINRADSLKFDFRKNGETDVAAVEQKFFAAKNTLANNVFNRVPDGGTSVQKKLKAMFAATESNQVMTLFISDGELSDEGPTLELLTGLTAQGVSTSDLFKRNPDNTPMIVVSCIRNTAINWPRKLDQKYCVAQMNDFNMEKNLFEARHGSIIRFSEAIFDILQITAPAPSAVESTGLQLYHLKGNDAYTQAQVAALQGYDNLPLSLYNMYLRDRQEFVEGRGVSTAVSVPGYFPGSFAMANAANAPVTQLSLSRGLSMPYRPW